MKLIWIGVALLLVGAGWVLAQDNYYHASTAAEGALNGMSQVARGAGEYNLMTSQAAINMTQAQSQEIKNRDEWTNTYFQMREANRQYRAAEKGPKPTMEQLVRYAQAGKPDRLSPSDLDSVSGRISWPILLQADRYAKYRSQLEVLFAKRAGQGTVSAEDYVAIDRTAKALQAELKKQVREVPQMDYIAARRFVESLAYEARVPVS